MLIRENPVSFVYTHFKSCDQPFDKTSFDFLDISSAMKLVSLIETLEQY